ncbi:cell wall-binding repeat-containing protein [Candidatus Poriferisodalis sp.]|uniref:cell wall-binding repeat-containing protein n=1 Tax=Candidatus Poriferisodalis sp. TaxID=3101277 RepID=UPI003B59AE8B
MLALVVALVALPVVALPAGANGGAANGDPSIAERISGPDRYATSLQAARVFAAALSPVVGSSLSEFLSRRPAGALDSVVLVSGQSWHDAVVAASVAGQLDAPVLLTPADGLGEEAMGFLRAAGVSEIVVIGNERLVTPTAVDALAEFDSEIERITRDDQYATASAVAQRIGDPGAMGSLGGTAILANGEVFADAMVAGTFSARGVHPVLLTPRDSLHPGAASYFSRGSVEHVVVMGGAAAVSAEVEQELRSLGVAVTRLAGATRFETAARTAAFIDGKYSGSPDRCFDNSRIGLANAHVPFDAFSAGPVLAKLCAPLLLTNAGSLDSATANAIEVGASAFGADAVVFGGTAAVSDNALLAGGSFSSVVQVSPRFYPRELEGAEALEELFAAAAGRRAEIVAALTAMIDSGEYGIDGDNVLRGPAGFEIDMGECPAEWSAATGITDSQIRIGQTAPQSGNLAAYGNIAHGLGNYFDWVNENDPIMVDGSPRDLTLIVKDDGYIGAHTIVLVDELIRAENVFAISTLDAVNALPVYGKINEECIPQPIVLGGYPVWGDPVNHPWTTGLQTSRSTESILWGAWIRDNLSDLLPVKVAGLVMDNSVSRVYEEAFEVWADANPDVVSEFLPVRDDPAAPTLTNEMAEIAASEPEVFISMTVGLACLMAVQEVGVSGLIDDIRARGGALFTPSLCKSIENYMKPAGDFADGWWIVGGASKDSTDPKYADDPFIQFVNQNLAAGGLDPTDSLPAIGYTFGYPYVEALRIAAELPGGLDRTNFILAMRSLSIHHPMIIDGIVAEFNGNDDAFFIEGSEILRFDATAQAWNQVGSIIDVNGQTPNCAWDLVEGECR